VTCGDLRGNPGRFSAEAVKLYDEEVGELPDADTGPASERRFIAAIEKRLRQECRHAAGDHDAKPAIARWLNSD
jgi:hypothetical protein